MHAPYLVVKPMIIHNILITKEFRLQGFTLMELMIVVVILGAVSLAGFPALMHVLNEQKLTTQVNDMVASLNLARSASIKRRYVVTIRKMTDWNNGWQIFVDEDNDNVLDVGEQVLKTYLGVTAGAGSITGHNFVNYIAYSPNGRANTLGNITFCPPVGVDSSRKIVIAGSGRMRTEKGDYAANCP